MDILSYFFKNGKGVEINKGTGEFKRTPLHKAVATDHEMFDTYSLLDANGADISVPDQIGQSTHFAPTHRIGLARQ